jgi:hypothetical protein
MQSHPVAIYARGMKKGFFLSSAAAIVSPRHKGHSCSEYICHFNAIENNRKSDLSHSFESIVVGLGNIK